MKIYTHISAGKYHPVQGEDHFYHTFLSDHLLVAAVMDGCSSGKESHFASNLYGKSLHKSCRQLPNIGEVIPDHDPKLIEKEAIGAFILGQLYEDIKKTKKLLFLDTEELLSTLILMIFDKKNKSAWVNVSGDGVVVCNSKILEIDQNNVPDYLAYHLDTTFDKWYSAHTKTMEFEDVYDISISTDGLQKLKEDGWESLANLDVVRDILVKQPDSSDDNALSQQISELIDHQNYIPYDDISFIRVIP